MNKSWENDAWAAVRALQPNSLAISVGSEAGQYPDEDFFLHFHEPIAATVMLAESGLQGPHALYVGRGKPKRPYPVLMEANGLYAETVGELQDLARVQYADAAPGAFDQARRVWQHQYTRLAADAGARIVAAHVIYEGSGGIADALVYPRAVSEQVSLAARESVVSGFDNLSAEQQLAARAILSGGRELQESTTLLLAAVMPDPAVMQIMSRAFYEK